MDPFENRIIRNMFASQYVAAWFNAGGTNRSHYDKDKPKGQRIKTDFTEWLRSLVIDGEHLTDEEIRFIDNFRGNGKLELEENARRFLNSK